MIYQNKEQAIRILLKNYLKKDNNLYISEKLFTAKSAINWIFDNGKQTELVQHYMKDVENFLKGEINLYWVNGILTKKKVIQNDKTNKEKK